MHWLLGQKTFLCTYLPNPGRSKYVFLSTQSYGTPYSLPSIIGLGKVPLTNGGFKKLTEFSVNERQNC